MLLRNWKACAAQVQAGPVMGLNQHSPDPYEGPRAGLTQVRGLCHCSRLRPSQSDPVTTSVIAPPVGDQPGHLAWVTKVLLDTHAQSYSKHMHTRFQARATSVFTHTHTHTHTHTRGACSSLSALHSLRPLTFFTHRLLLRLSTPPCRLHPAPSNLQCPPAPRGSFTRVAACVSSQPSQQEAQFHELSQDK